MKFLKIVMLVLVGALAIAAIASPAVAQCGEGDLFRAVSGIDPESGRCDPDENEGEKGEWNDHCAWLWKDSGGNWLTCTDEDRDPTGADYPESDDTARIPPGKCIRVKGANDAGILQVQKDENARGRVIYLGQDILTLHCDSVVDGDIIFLEAFTQEACDDLPGHLYIAHTNGDSVQISGNGGEIFSVAMCGLIEGDEGVELDLLNTAAGLMVISSHGPEIAISVALRNRGVVTTESNGRIELKGEDKYGDGVWEAAESGTLELMAGTEVYANGTWRIPDSGDSYIIINEPCLNLSGNFDLRNGVLQLHESICTTGDALFTADESEIDILLDAGVSARFNSSCN